MKVDVSIEISNRATDADGPFATATTQLVLEVESTNTTQAVADLIIAVEQAVSRLEL